MEISIIIPSINPDKWDSLYSQIENSVGGASFEVIFIGPNIGYGKFFESPNVRYIQERGCPSRALQIAVSLAVGKYFCWFPDDATLDKDSLNKCLELIESKPYGDGIIMRYDEGGNRQDQDSSYWVAGTHADLRLPGINPDWNISPVFFFNRQFFIKNGGIDCAMEHINMNGHSFCFMLQHGGNRMHMSPSRVFSVTYSHPPSEAPLFRAYHENDYPRFRFLWSHPDAVHRYKIDFDNWKSIPHLWPRRYSK